MKKGRRSGSGLNLSVLGLVLLGLADDEVAAVERDVIELQLEAFAVLMGQAAPMIRQKTGLPVRFSTQ